MTGDLELKARSCKTFEELKDVVVKIAEAFDDCLDNEVMIDELKDRIKTLEDSQ